MNRSVRGLGIRTGLGKKDKWLPSVRNGLTFCWHAQAKTDRPHHSAAGTAALTTETVDADRKALPFYGQVLIAGTANTVHIGRNGMLAEPARTNLCKQSEDMNTTWSKLRATITVNDTAAPDGASTADKIVEDSNNNTHLIRQTITVADATQYCLSVYAKAGERSAIRVYVFTNFAGNAHAYFDLSAGTEGTNGAGADSAGIEDVGNGWYRCWVIATSTGAGACSYQIQPCIAEAHSYQGDGSSGLYFWGAQVEAGAAPSSYIPTTTAAVARAAEDLDTTAGANASFAAGTLTVGVVVDGLLGAAQTICDIYASANDRITLDLDTAGKPHVYVNDGGSKTAELTATSALTAGTPAVITICWDTDDVRMYVNGADAQADTSAAMPSGTITLFWGQTGGNAAQLSGQAGPALFWDRAQTVGEVENVYRRDCQKWLGDRI